jgi:hypothetical protein
MDQVTVPRATVQQALHVATAAAYPVALIAALRAALEQPEQATVKESLTTGEPPKFEAVPYSEVQPYPFEMPPLTPEQLARVSAGMRALKLTMTEVEQQEQEQGTEQQHPARQRFDDTGGREEPDPVERLRFFCSLAMNKQDWLDVEAFFDDVLAERQKNAALEQPEPDVPETDCGNMEPAA